MSPQPKPVPRGPRPRRPKKTAGRIRTRRQLGTVRREAKAAGHVDPHTWEAIVEFYDGLCCHCEQATAEEQDHFFPVSRGGAHAPFNVGPSCARCNANKGTRTRYPRRRHPFMEAAA